MNTGHELSRSDYLSWLKSAASDCGSIFRDIDSSKKKQILDSYKKFLNDPASVYAPLDEVTLSRIERVAGNGIRGTILLGTDAVVFSQSIFTDSPGSFDYAISMNRRYFMDSWFSVLTLNNSYVKLASDAMLGYTVLHQLLQKQLYEEHLRAGMKMFTPAEKSMINRQAMMKSIEITNITEQELIREREYMLTLSYQSPLIPKPFAETSLFKYLEKHKQELEYRGTASVNEEEEEMGRLLYEDFVGWLDFSDEAFGVFYEELNEKLKSKG